MRKTAYLTSSLPRGSGTRRVNTEAIRCPVGRPFKPQNVTCQSCIRQGIVCRQEQGATAKVMHPVVTVHSGQVVITTQYLNGMNHWHGRPRYVYAAERRLWEKVLDGTWALWGLQEKIGGKRFLMVRRYVVDPRCIIKDRDNLIGALKPVKDVLVSQRVFTDDADQYLEFDIVQEIDKENPRIEIEVWPL